MKNCTKCLCYECSLNDRSARIKCDVCAKCRKNERLSGIRICSWRNNPESFVGPGVKKNPPAAYLLQ